MYLSLNVALVVTIALAVSVSLTLAAKEFRSASNVCGCIVDVSEYFEVETH